jgi:hypothetical protein
MLPEDAEATCRTRRSTRWNIGLSGANVRFLVPMTGALDLPSPASPRRLTVPVAEYWATVLLVLADELDRACLVASHAVARDRAGESTTQELADWLADASHQLTPDHPALASRIQQLATELAMQRQRELAQIAASAAQTGDLCECADASFPEADEADEPLPSRAAAAVIRELARRHNLDVTVVDKDDPTPPLTDPAVQWELCMLIATADGLGALPDTLVEEIAVAMETSPTEVLDLIQLATLEADAVSDTVPVPAVGDDHDDDTGPVEPVTVAELADGDQFSLDGGTTWYVCAVVLFGTVSVYTGHRRDDQAPTLRVPADPDQNCLRRAPRHVVVWPEPEPVYSGRAGIVLTRQALRAWGGHELSNDQATRLARAIVGSTIPQSIGDIVATIAPLVDHDLGDAARTADQR